jgi:DNA-binding GntR family transcriptional regulator
MTVQDAIKELEDLLEQINKAISDADQHRWVALARDFVEAANDLALLSKEPHKLFH